MRGLIACPHAYAWRFIALAAALAATSCTRTVAAIPEAPAELLSVVEVADPNALVQLVHGFWKVEGGSWRWTAKRFRVVLRPPKGSATKGARLELRFSLPQAILSEGPATVTATVNGLLLRPAVFAQEGEQTFSGRVPAEALGNSAVTVEFTTDRALPESAGDERELAMVVHRIGLLAD